VDWQDNLEVIGLAAKCLTAPVRWNKHRDVEHETMRKTNQIRGCENYKYTLYVLGLSRGYKKQTRALWAGRQLNRHYNQDHALGKRLWQTPVAKRKFCVDN
jgi:hypothetical protein